MYAPNVFRIRRRVGLLGCGAFGAVELVEHTGLGDTYALKAAVWAVKIKVFLQSENLPPPESKLNNTVCQKNI